jgi:hypothetical protein
VLRGPIVSAKQKVVIEGKSETAKFRGSATQERWALDGRSSYQSATICTHHSKAKFSRFSYTARHKSGRIENGEEQDEKRLSGAKHRRGAVRCLKWTVDYGEQQQ